MPGLLDLISDPLFQQLPEDRQYELRKDYFKNQVATDPLFQKLTPDRQNAIGRDVLFEVKPNISQAQFEKSRGLAPGSSGGITPVPFLQDPVTMAAMAGLGFPLGAGPSALYGGRAAGLGEQALRGAGTFGSFGAVQGAEEGGVGGAIKGALKEGLVGAAFGPALAPAKTVLGAIGKPIAIGAPVGFATAEPGHRLEGAALGAASFLGLKGATRAVGYGAEKLGEALSPVRRLFARGGQAIVDKYGVVDRPVADAPAGLTEEVFRNPADEIRQFESFLERAPQTIEQNIAASAKSAEDFLIAKGRMPGVPALREPTTLRPGQIVSAPDLPQIGLPRSVAIGQEPPYLPTAPGRAMPVPAGRISLPEWNPPVPAPIGKRLPTGITGPIIQPPSVFVPGPSIRMGPPRTELLPPAGTGETVAVLRERFATGAPSPTAEEQVALLGFYNDQKLPVELRNEAGNILGRYVAERPKPIVPPAPPVEVAPTPVAPKAAKGKAPVIPDEEVAFSTFLKRSIDRWGKINPGKDEASIRSALGAVEGGTGGAHRRYNGIFSSKGKLGVDEFINSEVVGAQFLEKPSLDDFIELVKNPAGKRSMGSQEGGRYVVSPKEDAISAVISDIEHNTDINNLIQLADGLRRDDPIYKAAMRQIETLQQGAKVGENGLTQLSDITDGRVRDALIHTVIGGKTLGKGPYTQDQISMATQIANQIEQKGLLKTDVGPVTPQKTAPKVEAPLAPPDIAMTKEAAPIYEKTLAGEQALIPGAEGRTVQTGPLRPKAPQTEKPLDLEMPGIQAKEPGLFETPTQQLGMPLPRTANAQAFLEGPADQAVLHGLGEGDLNDLAAKAMQPGEIQHAEVVSKEFADRMTGPRPINPNPLDDLGKAERENSLSKLLNILKDEKGIVSIGQDPKETSLSKDMNGFFDRWQNIFQSWKNIELRRGVDAFVRRGISVQELARTHPEINPIYQPFHAYPREAVNRHVKAITPLFKQEDRLPYFTLPDAKREAVDKLAILQNLNRQDLPRFTPEELAKRGFDKDQVGAFNDMLDYGQAILRDRRKWYVESQLPAMVEAGTPEIVARATLEARAEKALKGMEHWVPHYRAGDKTIVVRDRDGKLASYNMVNSVRDRVDTVTRLKQEFPASQGYKIEEGVLENFVRAKAFDEIDIANLEILSRFAKVDPTIADEFLTQLRPALLSRSEAMSQFKHFENVPGFKQDLREGLIKSGNSAYTYIERQRAYQAATDALANINAKEKPELFKFADRYIKDNMLPGEKKIGEIQDALYAYVLGGSIKQIPVQLSQVLITVIPRMLKFGSMSEVGDALGMMTKWSFARDLTKAPTEYQALLREGFKKGSIQPRAEMFAGDALAKLPWAEAQVEKAMADQLMQFQHPAAHAMHKARDLWMLPITDADMRTRMGALIGFYKLGREAQHMNPAQAREFAITEANRTNSLYGRAESPELFGRHGLPRFVNMLKQWPAQYASFLGGVLRDARTEALGELAKQGITQVSRPELYKQVMKTTDFKTFASSLAAMTALGGVYYNIPGFMKTALSSLWGVDPETAARDLLTNKMGLPDIATDIVLRGVGTLAGVDVSRSMALGDMFGMQAVTDILGPGPAVVENVAKGAWDLVQSQTQPFGPSAVDALERMSPNGFKNIIKGAALAAEGIQTRRGGQLPGTATMRAVDPILQGLGFTPLAVAEAKAAQRASETRDRFHRSQQSNMLENLAEAIVKNKQDDVASVYARIQKVNEDAVAKGRPELLITINNGQLRQRIAEMLTPAAKIKRVPKNARAAELELQRLYLGEPPPPP